MIRYGVDLGNRSYDIDIGDGTIERIGEVLEREKASSVLIVTNTTVAELYLKRVESAIQKRLTRTPLTSVILPDGECYKNLDHIEVILDAAQTARLDRHSVMVALGGGVVGDMTGFAASMWMRGIAFVQIPTTLLSQVDSSVGGKTGVNLPAGKNLIGAFYQPRAVLVDTSVLKTLPRREIAAGLAEIVKYGFLGDEAFVEFLEKNARLACALETEVLERTIARCCAMKADIVKKDEREQGVRAHLNLGHTFAHAIEKLTGYGTWLHGEAVGVGCVMAADLSYRLGYLSETDVTRVRNLVDAVGLPTRIAGISADAAIESMRGDKKAISRELRFVVMDAIGKCHTQSVSEADVRETLRVFGWR